MKFITSIAQKFLYSIAFLMLAAVAAFFTLPQLDGFGTLDVKIVKSGSMEPAIMTGAVVFIREFPAYNNGDVITFTSQGSVIPTTHRIIGTEESAGRTLFVTKGDANEERDTVLVAPEDTIGKVIVDAPYLGFIIDFARQPIGFALLIVLPALLIIIDELETIYREWRRLRTPTPTRALRVAPAPLPALVIEPYRPVRQACMDIRRPVPVVPPAPERRVPTRPSPLSSRRSTREQFFTGLSTVTMITLLAGSLSFFSSTLSFFSDTESSTNNYFEARVLDFSLAPSTVPVTFHDSESSLTGGVMVEFTPLPTLVEPLVYTLATSFVSGSSSLCAAVTADAGTPIDYFGPLLSLASPSVTASGPWSLDFALEPGAYSSGDTCRADITVGARFADAPTAGYLDTEVISLFFTVFESQVVQIRVISSAELTGGAEIDESMQTETVEEVASSEDTDFVPDHAADVPVDTMSTTPSDLTNLPDHSKLPDLPEEASESVPWEQEPAEESNGAEEEFEVEVVTESSATVADE